MEGMICDKIKVMRMYLLSIFMKISGIFYNFALLKEKKL